MGLFTTTFRTLCHLPLQVIFISLNQFVFVNVSFSGAARAMVLILPIKYSCYAYYLLLTQ